MPNEPKVSLGGIVHFVMPSGDHRAAIVTNVRNPESEDPKERSCVDLYVFLDKTKDTGTVDTYRVCKVYHGTPEPVDPSQALWTLMHPCHTWHWPEREEEAVNGT